MPSGASCPAISDPSQADSAQPIAAAQLTSAAGFLVFALAGATAAPGLAAAGGAAGSGAVLTAAWTAGGDWEKRLPLNALRYATAALLLAAALVVGLSARGLLG